MSKQLLMVNEVAEVLRVGRTTIYNLIKSGELKSVNVAGCRRVADSDLEEYIESLRADVS